MKPLVNLTGPDATRGTALCTKCGAVVVWDVFTEEGVVWDGPRLLLWCAVCGNKEERDGNR